MPRVIIKLHPGRSKEQKSELAKKIVENVVSIAKCGKNVVSVSIEEVKTEEWHDKVYEPDIQNKQNRLFKKAGLWATQRKMIGKLLLSDL